MPYPSTAKPTVAELLSTDPLYSILHSKIPFCGPGWISDICNNRLPRVNPYPDGSTGYYGPTPTLDPAAVALNGIAFPGYAGGFSRPSLQFAGSGYGTTPAIYSFSGVFKASFGHPTQGNIVQWFASTAGYSNQNSTSMFGIKWTGTEIRLAYCDSQSGITSTIALIEGRSYAVSVTIDNTSSAARTLTWRVYDYTTQTLVTPANGTVQSAGDGAAYNFGSTPDLMIGSTAYSGFTAYPIMSRLLDIAIYGGAFTDSLFAGYYQDPWSVCRGVYTPSGPLAASDVTGIDSGNTTIWLAATRPTGGTGPYSYQWHRSATSNFTPGGGTAVAGATSLALTDTPPIGPDAYWYKLVATDAAGASVIYTQVGMSLKPKPDLKILLMGDSIHVVNATNVGASQDIEGMVLAGSGRRVTYHGRGISGSQTSGDSWGLASGLTGAPGPLLAAAVADAVADGLTVASIMLGANDAAGTSPTQYQTNFQGITNYLAANGIAKIIPHKTTSNQQPGAGFDASNALIEALHPAIDALVAANPGLVFLGDTDNYKVTMISSYMFQGLHPLPSQMALIGAGWGRADLAVIDGAGGGGGGGTSTDPGQANVRLNAGYTINGVAKTGALVVPSPANTKIGVQGDAGAGTYDGSDRWSDPGVTQVESGTVYKANSPTVNRTGTLVASAGGGSGLSNADADLVVTRLLAHADAIVAGETFRQSLRKIESAVAGDMDTASVAGTAIFKLGTVETHRVPIVAAGRGPVVNGGGL